MRLSFIVVPFALAGLSGCASLGYAAYDQLAEAQCDEVPGGQARLDCLDRARTDRQDRAAARRADRARELTASPPMRGEREEEPS